MQNCKLHTSNSSSLLTSGISDETIGASFGTKVSAYFVLGMTVLLIVKFNSFFASYVFAFFLPEVWKFLCNSQFSARRQQAPELLTAKGKKKIQGGERNLSWVSIGKQPNFDVSSMATGVEVAEDLTGTTWRDDQWFAYYQLHRGTALDYFFLSPFYDRNCNNELARMQALDPSQLAYVSCAVQATHIFFFDHDITSTILLLLRLI